MQEFTGKEYTMIAIANAYGLDRINWEDRLNWVNNHMDRLYEYIDVAKEPFLMTKAIQALSDAKAGNPTGFIMGLDATASGLQLMACITGCIASAQNTNLINVGGIVDIYDTVADEMNIHGCAVTRAQVKHPVMTTFYGSKAQPKRLFGEGTKELRYFYRVLNTELPGAMKLLKIMQGYWNPMAIEHSWSLPDGHVVVAPVYQKVDKKIEVDELRHATFKHRADVIVPSKTGLSLAANIIHSIDGYVVREMMRRTKAVGVQMASIHDSFWAHPNDMNIIRELYVEILAEIADSHIMTKILYEISGKKIRYTKRSNILSTRILESEYALS